MNNTRTHDLDILSDSRNTVESHEARVHREALLTSVYEQSKDAFLEKKRMELTKWIIHGLSYAPDSGIPSIKQKTEMATSEYHIQRIEQEIRSYTQSDSFKQNLASKLAKVNEVEAEILMKG